MNTTNKKRLKELELNHYQERSTMPIHTIPLTAFSDKTANGLTKAICSFLNYSGCQAERINTMGVYREKRNTIGKVIGGQWTKGTGTPGSADISATIRGRSVKIEVKIGKDKQSEAQKNYQSMIEKSGGTYYIAKDFDTFLQFYDDFIAQIK